MDRTEAPARSGSQSKLPPILLWLVLAAILFRVITGVMDREKKGEGAGLIQWQPQKEAEMAARSAGRPVLYDFTAAWCAPCHQLDTEGWGDPRVASLVNQSYLPARVVDREREDGKNPAAIDELQRRYSVNAFPTLIVAAPDGRLIARMQGYGGREKLLQFLEESSHKTP